MYRIDNNTASTTKPAKKPLGNPGYFTPGTVGGQAATIVEADWLNIVQEEMAAIVAQAGMTLDKANDGQVIAAILSLIANSTRRRLTGPLNLYVSPTGSDLNDGLTPATAFATLTAAWNYILQRLDVGAQSVTVNVAHGTYSHTALFGAPPGATGWISFVGDPANPAAVVLTGNNNNAVDIYAAIVAFDGFTLQTTGTFAGGFNLQVGAALSFKNCIFGPMSGSHINSSLSSIVSISGPYAISGGAVSHFSADASGAIGIGGNLSNFNFTLSGTPAFSNAFALAQDAGIINMARTGYAYIGAATGPRYNANTNGVIRADGLGANYFPGSVAGAVNYGGVYVP